MNCLVRSEIFSTTPVKALLTSRLYERRFSPRPTPPPLLSDGLIQTPTLCLNNSLIMNYRSVSPTHTQFPSKFPLFELSTLAPSGPIKVVRARLTHTHTHFWTASFSSSLVLGHGKDGAISAHRLFIAFYNWTIPEIRLLSTRYFFFLFCHRKLYEKEGKRRTTPDSRLS